MALQAQIRQNAMSMSDYLGDLKRWESSVKGKDEELRRKAYGMEGGNVPVRGAVAEKVKEKDAASKAKAANAHVYDVGYKKWENFDVDAALNSVDDEDDGGGKKVPKPRRVNAKAASSSVKKTARVFTPASVVDEGIKMTPVDSAAKVVRSDAPAPAEQKPRDIVERETGNAYYKKGDFVHAIQSYTRAIGFNPQSALAHSNRAMTYLKLKEFANAELDASAAILIDARHVKSYLRRASARNALGKHRAAFLDLKCAQKLDAKNKTVRAELRKTRDLIKASVRRAPKTKVPIETMAMDGEKEEVVVNRDGEEMIESPPVIDTAADEPATKVDRALAIAREKQARIAAGPAPKTHYEFRRAWTSLSSGDGANKSSNRQQHAYLMRVTLKRLAKIFAKSALEADDLVSYVCCLGKFVDATNAHRTAKMLFAISKAKSFDMSVMFLEKGDLDAIASALNAIHALSPLDETLLRAFRC